MAGERTVTGYGDISRGFTTATFFPAQDSGVSGNGTAIKAKVTLRTQKLLEFNSSQYSSSCKLSLSEKERQVQLILKQVTYASLIGQNGETSIIQHLSKLHFDWMRENAEASFNKSFLFFLLKELVKHYSYFIKNSAVPAMLLTTTICQGTYTFTEETKALLNAFLMIVKGVEHDDEKILEHYLLPIYYRIVEEAEPHRLQGIVGEENKKKIKAQLEKIFVAPSLMNSTLRKSTEDLQTTGTELVYLPSDVVFPSEPSSSKKTVDAEVSIAPPSSNPLRDDRRNSPPRPPLTSPSVIALSSSESSVSASDQQPSLVTQTKEVLRISTPPKSSPTSCDVDQVTLATTGVAAVGLTAGGLLATHFSFVGLGFSVAATPTSIATMVTAGIMSALLFKICVPLLAAATLVILGILLYELFKDRPCCSDDTVTKCPTSHPGFGGMM